MSRFLRNNGLSIVFFVLFLTSLFLGQSMTGRMVYNEERKEDGKPVLGYIDYLVSPHSLEATMENWESEFLQMYAFVVLTVFLYQRGSSESRKLPEESGGTEPEDVTPSPDAPWPVRHGGVALRLYSHSLSAALALLFVLSFMLHVIYGAQHYSEEQIAKGMQPVRPMEYLGTSQLWFESFQNWQSEFLAVGSMMVLSIFLREKGSPQSKNVADPHSKTGGGDQ